MPGARGDGGPQLTPRAGKPVARSDSDGNTLDTRPQSETGSPESGGTTTDGEDDSGGEEWAGAVPRAAMLVKYARHRKVFSADGLVTRGQWRALSASRLAARLQRLVLILYMLAYLFEVPSWCWLVEDRCIHNKVFALSPFSMHMQVEVTRIFEIFCLSYLLSQEVAQSFALGVYGGWARFNGVIIIFAIVDNAAAIFNDLGLPPKEIFWSRLLRPFVYLGQSVYVQDFFRDALPALANRRVVDLIAMEVVLMFMWAWFGLLLFGHTDEGDTYFASPDAAFINLFTLFTTANFPDVMMPAYKDNRLMAVYFFLFLVLSLYMFFNVLLAALFNAYKSQVRLTRERAKSTSRAALDLIFDILAGHDEGGCFISESTWRRFWSCYCRERSLEWNRERAERLFGILDCDYNRRLSREEWQEVGALLVNPQVMVRRQEPTTTPPRMLQAVECMHLCVDASVTVTLLCTLFQTRRFLLTGRHRWQEDWRLQAVEFTCCALYLAETAVRLAAFGHKGYFNNYRYVVDSLMAVGSSTLEVLVGIAPLHYDRGWGKLRRVMVLLRVARAERILWRCTRLREALYTLLALLATFRKVGSALVLLFYFYSTLGVQIFGGRVRTDSKPLRGTPYAAADYYANNFNDFASGLVVLFELMVVNNWYVIAGGLAAVAPGTPYVGWAFCISFYVCVHVVILNVLVTSIVESYERILPTMNPEEMGAPHKYAQLHAESDALLLGEDEALGQCQELLGVLSGAPMPRSRAPTDLSQPSERGRAGRGAPAAGRLDAPVIFERFPS